VLEPAGGLESAPMKVYNLPATGRHLKKAGATYFGGLEDNLGLACQSARLDACTFDLVRAPEQFAADS